MRTFRIPARLPIRASVALVAVVASTAAPTHAAISIYDNFADFQTASFFGAGLACDFDPATVTTLLPGWGDDLGCLSGSVFFWSPEAPDTTMIYRVGEPGGNGCVAGAGPEWEVGEGSLWFFTTSAQSIAFDIRSSASSPITVRVYDSNQQLVASATGPTEFVGAVSDDFGGIWYVELIPGTLGDGSRDPTCFDNLLYGHPPLQTSATTWGRLKALHR